MWLLLEMWWLIKEIWWLITENMVAYYWRCGGSLVALQTAETVVTGSNPASRTVKNSEDWQSNYGY